MSSFTLKSDQAEYLAVILPFHNRWHETITSGRIGVVFRKRGPSTAVPEWMYAYFSAPISAIGAKVKIKKIEHLPIDEALAHCEFGGLTKDELIEYAGDYRKMCVYHVGRVYATDKMIKAAILFQRFQFCPTPNYVALSDEGIREFDLLLGLEGEQ